MADNTEILRRRTFAIIAHPDAGKTSLTEKLLLFGGQIQVWLIQHVLVKKCQDEKKGKKKPPYELNHTKDQYTYHHQLS